MSKKIIKNIPNLRFPEFVNEQEWEKVKLSKLGKLVSGLTYSPDDVRENGLLVLRSSNVQDGEISLEDNVYVRTDIKGANLSEPNDILICVRNGSKALIGKNALIPDNMPLCTHGAFMTIFRAELPKFVFQLFQTKDYERQVNADLGATINSINGNKFIKYEFYVPTNEKEQKKIADCLSSIDSLISVQIQKVKLLKEHKKGLLENIFPQNNENIPKFRFPEFKNDCEWEKHSLGDIGIFLRGFTYSSNDVDEDGLLVLRSSNIKDDQLVLNKDLVFVNKACSSELLLQNGDIVICMSNGSKSLVGKSATYLGNYDAQVTIGAFCSLFRPKISLAKYIFQTNDYQKFVAISIGGGNINNLKNSDLELFPIYLPKAIEEQKKIADCLTSIDEEINLQIQKVESLKEHKKALMQQLLPLNDKVSI